MSENNTAENNSTVNNSTVSNSTVSNSTESTSTVAGTQAVPSPATTQWTVGALLKWTADYLAVNGSDAPRLDAEVLLAHVKQCGRIDLYTQFDQPQPENIRQAYREAIRQRAQGMPTAYLVGQREFYSMPFWVTPDVLIPRPETEHLITAVLDLIKRPVPEPDWTDATDVADQSDTDQDDTDQDVELNGVSVKANPLRDVSLNILDLGTGSGIIPVCLARQLPASNFVAVDISAPALEIAKQNATRHKVADQIDFRQSDLFAQIDKEEQFDFIVSNPPYIGEGEMAGLDRSVRDFEPHMALCSGPAGTEIIERILQSAADFLADDGWLMFELSPVIHDSVVEMLHQSKTFTYVETIPDFARLPRIVVCKKTAEK